jgi:glycosyltransferase involved in cell wall biosynthesis
MKLLMISGDRSILSGKKGAFWYTLQEMQKYWERIDIICPRRQMREQRTENREQNIHGNDAAHNVFLHPNPHGLLSQSSWIFQKGKELIREHHHDVMTVHEYPPFYNGRGAIALHNKTKIPFALEIHHIVGWPVAANLQEWIGRALSHWVLPREAQKAARVRAVSMPVEQEMQRWGISSKKMCNIPSFYLDHDLIGRISAPPKSYDIAFCGRLVANKGLDAVIDSLQYLPDARLLIVGDGPLRKEFEKKVRSLGIGNRVTFLGWLPTLEAVLDAVLTARTFVMSSLSEGGPRSALEAMACGMPVVVTRVGIMPEVVEDGVSGLFTDGSARDIAAKVGNLLRDDAKREKMGMAAKGILKRFERCKLIEQYAHFLQEIPSAYHASR